MQSCQRGLDPSRELNNAQLAAATYAAYTADLAMIADADIVIVAVTTLVYDAHIPDFKPLIGASTSVGRAL